MALQNGEEEITARRLREDTDRRRLTLAKRASRQSLSGPGLVENPNEGHPSLSRVFKASLAASCSAVAFRCPAPRPSTRPSTVTSAVNPLA